MNTIPKAGDTVTWKAAGKVSRLDGVAGKVVSGVVIEIRDRSIVVKKNYESVVPLGTVDVVDVINC